MADKITPSYTRDQLAKVITDGGSVLHNGQQYTTVESLPTEADLAAGNPAAQKQALASLDAQMEATAAARAKLAGEMKEAEENAARQREADKAKQADKAKADSDRERGESAGGKRK